jgi:FSR family fosmidomycin resistance protein-like MFS transporter
MISNPVAPDSDSKLGSSKDRQTLIIAGLAHALHDGYTDLIYVLLPIWQTEFSLSYSALALLRALYTSTMAAFQVQAGSVANRFGGRAVLAFGTSLAALGYMLAGFTGSLLGLCVALVIGGLGSSTQHPIASAAVSRAYGTRARGPLGTYNFSGDLGKAAFPAAASLLLTLMPWRGMLRLIAMLGIVTAIAIALFMPAIDRERTDKNEIKVRKRGEGMKGFALLFAIGVLDTAARMGLLTFLPFLLKAKGATLPTVGLALSLVFVGGAAGKFACGWLGSRIGMMWTVLLTEGGTAIAILIVLVLSLHLALIVLPVLGIMLNGTSSVLYGTVPELTAADQAERFFALFYTGTIGSGALAPVLYGMLGDAVGAPWATVATAATALATLPLAIALAPRLTVD